MRSNRQHHKNEIRNEKDEIHEFEKAMQSNSQHHKVEMKDERPGIQEIEGDAGNHIALQNKLKKSYMYS